MKDSLTAQEMFEDFIRHQVEACGGSPEMVEIQIADYRKSFPKNNNPPPTPAMIAMMDAAKQETEDFVKRLERLAAQAPD